MILQYQKAGVGVVVVSAKLPLLVHCKKYFEKAALHAVSSLLTKSQVHDRHSFDCKYLIAQALILLVVYAEQAVEP